MRTKSLSSLNAASAAAAMDSLLSTASHTEEHTLLRKRNSTLNSSGVSPTNLITLLAHRSSSASTITATTTSSSYSTSSFPSEDLEFITMKPKPQSYTSLKDLLPSAAVNSPKSAAAAHPAQPGSEICIRNRLVKQAAWAYLQPMSSSPGPTNASFFHSLWPRVAALFGLLCRNFMIALDRTLCALRIRSAR